MPCRLDDDWQLEGAHDIVADLRKPNHIHDSDEKVSHHLSVLIVGYRVPKITLRSSAPDKKLPEKAFALLAGDLAAVAQRDDVVHSGVEELRCIPSPGVAAEN